MPYIIGIYPLLSACDFIDHSHSLENENRLASPFLCFAAQKWNPGINFPVFYLHVSEIFITFVFDRRTLIFAPVLDLRLIL